MKKLQILISRRLSAIAAEMVKQHTKDLKVCIFSNDCWGAEFYRCTNRRYNTPFVGLMLMAPCYVKFLQNPGQYVNYNLKFIEKSKYKNLQEFREKFRTYPVGLIEDIEVHFLHYANCAEACQKWNARKRRIDWNNLYVKFAMDKDYATEEIFEIFKRLPYKNKISFSKYDYNALPNVRVSNYVENGAQMFPRSFREIDLLHWFRHGTIRRARRDVALKNLFISRFLKIN